MYTHTSPIYYPERYSIYGTWMLLSGHIVYGTYMAVTCEVNVAFHCVLANISNCVGLYDNIVWGKCNLYLQCCSHIWCTYIFHIFPWKVCHTWYAKCGGHICFWLNTVHCFITGLERRWKWGCKLIITYLILICDPYIDDRCDVALIPGNQHWHHGISTSISVTA